MYKRKTGYSLITKISITTKKIFNNKKRRERKKRKEKEKRIEKRNEGKINSDKPFSASPCSHTKQQKPSHHEQQFQ